MSLIFGVNLSDRVYIAGDTRLVHKKDGVFVKKDKIIKVVPFSENIIGSFAGSARMSSFIARRLSSLIINLDIRTFKLSVENILGPLIDEYWRTIDPDGKFVVIFGGLNKNAKKKINAREIYNRVRYFSDLDKEGQSMNMKSVLFNEVMRASGQPLRYPELPDSYVFSCEIIPPNTFYIQGAEWGEYLAYGPCGIQRDALDPIIFGKLEFIGGENDISKDNSMITAALKEVAEKSRSETIGGPFFSMVIGENGVGVITGRLYRMALNTGRVEFISETLRIGDSFYSKDENGTLHKLTPLTNFKDFGSLEI